MRKRAEVSIAKRKIGDGHPIFIIAEIGINHNGSLAIAKELISAAAAIGCDAVKFQKRNIDVVYSKEELAKPRESPFGSTNGDLKRALEFDERAYSEIDAHCRSNGIAWFASAWDKDSVDFLEEFDVPCYKIASASLTDAGLLKRVKATRKPVLLSTGMSTMSEIRQALRVLGESPTVLLQCTSTYPCDPSEINLRVMLEFRRSFNCPVGYSGHEVGVMPSVVAAALGACVIERHLTLDRAMWGSDQAASLEVPGMQRLVRDIRLLPTVLGDGQKRRYVSEEAVLKKLRRVDSFGRMKSE